MEFVRRLTSESSAFLQGSGWRSYENYIGASMFYKQHTQEIRSSLLSNPKITETVEEITTKKTDRILEKREIFGNLQNKENVDRHLSKKDKIRKKYTEQAAKTIDSLIADVNSIRSVRFFAYVLNGILVRLYHQGIRVKDSEIIQLQKWAMHAAQNKLSLIILPCHKSHVDYLVISYVFYRLGLALPHIAAGDNLNIFGIGRLLRKGGAFFIRRSWGDDVLYTSIVTEYVQLLLERGHNIECFIEGTRSRTGKLLSPKFGMLKIILDGLLSGRTPDCIMVPVSIGYDKVIETETYVNELMGRPKTQESFWNLFNNYQLIQLKGGRIDVRFAQPFSLNEYVNQQLVLRRNVDFNVEADKRVILRALGYRILSDINAISVVMPTALVGTIILTLRGRGIGKNELTRKVDWLREQILRKGGHVAHFEGMTIPEIVAGAVKVLKDTIGTRKDCLEDIFYAKNWLELSYYRNQVIHLFISEAVVAVALYVQIRRGASKQEQKMDRPNLLQLVTFLSQLLQVEFIYRPGNINANLESVLQSLKEGEIVDYNGETIELSEKERSIGREHYDFYCFLLWPFIESYWLAAVSLFALLPVAPPSVFPADSEADRQEVTWVDERVFVAKAQLLGKTLFYEGDLTYMEAINKETLNNAFLSLKRMNVLLDRPNQIALHPAYVPSQRSFDKIGLVEKGKLWQLVETISGFRLEGKTRRDTPTVNRRILWFTQQVGSAKWKGAGSKELISKL